MNALLARMDEVRLALKEPNRDVRADSETHNQIKIDLAKGETSGDPVVDLCFTVHGANYNSAFEAPYRRLLEQAKKGKDALFVWNRRVPKLGGDGKLDSIILEPTFDIGALKEDMKIDYSRGVSLVFPMDRHATQKSPTEWAVAHQPMRIFCPELFAYSVPLDLEQALTFPKDGVPSHIAMKRSEQATPPFPGLFVLLGDEIEKYVNHAGVDEQYHEGLKLLIK